MFADPADLSAGGDFFVSAVITKRIFVPRTAQSGTHASSDFDRMAQIPGISGDVSRRLDRDLEIVEFSQHNGMVTVQVALKDNLVVPMTVDAEEFYQWADDEQRNAWLKRQATQLLTIYGDARDGRVLSDQEVLLAANA